MVKNEASVPYMNLTLPHITHRAYPHAFAVPERKVGNHLDCT
jgi:hypothetical protein